MAVVDSHHRAMELAEQADMAKLRGDRRKAGELLKEAFHLERKAAERFRDQFTMEPTRSILYRSSASLALECGEFGEAIRMIALGLAGNPPAEIANELKALYKEVCAETGCEFEDDIDHVVSFLRAEIHLAAASSIIKEIEEGRIGKRRLMNIYVIDSRGNSHPIQEELERVARLFRQRDLGQATGTDAINTLENWFLKPRT